MSNPFEVYAERNAEIVYERNTYRIEVLKCYSNPNTPYVVRYWVQEHVNVQPSYPRLEGQYERTPEDIEIWKTADLPWVVANDPDSALSKAFIFFEEKSQGHWLGSRCNSISRSRLRICFDLEESLLLSHH